MLQPQVPSVAQHLVNGAQAGQRFCIGQDVGPVPELELPASIVDPESPPELVAEVPHTPATHVCPSSVQFSQTWPGAPHDMSRVPSTQVPLTSQHPVQVPPPSKHVPLAPVPGPLPAVLFVLPHAMTTNTAKVDQHATRMGISSFPELEGLLS
jgi:hypothetical protein